jgi:hypothetical protein
MAQVDPAANGIGIYFDEGATNNCFTSATPFQAVTAYLFLTNLDEPSGCAGWEASVEYTGLTAPGFTHTLGTAVTDVGSGFEHICGLGGNVLPPAPVHVLGTVVGYVMDPTVVVEYFIRPVSQPSVDGAVVYGAGSDPGLYTPMIVSTGGFDVPVATINAACIVPVDEETWGGVKALYQ